MTLVNLKEKDPDEIIEVIEKSNLEKYQTYEICDMFILALKKYESIGNIDQIKKLRKETKIFGMDYSISNRKFIPSFGDCVEFNDEEIEYYKTRAAKTKNSILKARYCDVLWEFKKDINFLKSGIISYLESSNDYFRVKNYHYMVHALFKAFSFSKTMKNDTLGLKCLEEHLKFLKRFKEMDEIRWMYDIIDSILDNGYFIRANIDLNLILSYIQDNLEQYQLKQDFHWQQLYLDLEKKYYEFLNDSEQKLGVSIKMAQTYEKEAEIRNREGKNNLLSATFYRYALEIYQNIGGYDEKVKELKIKLDKSYQEGIKKEMIPVTIPNSFEEKYKKDAEEFVNSFKKKSLKEIIEIISKKKVFPSYTDWLLYAQDPKNQSAILNIFPIVEVEEGRMKGKYHGEESIERNAIQYYRLSYYQFIQYRLMNLFKYINEKFPEYDNELISKFNKCDIIIEERIDFIRYALLKFKDKDYIGMIHVLTFQIEGILRDLLIRFGEPRQKVLPNRDQFYLLGQIINRLGQFNQEDDFFVELLKLIEVYLVNDLGDNVRNLIGHGFFAYNSFDIGVALFLIFILLRLSSKSFEKS